MTDVGLQTKVLRQCHQTEQKTISLVYSPMKSPIIIIIRHCTNHQNHDLVFCRLLNLGQQIK